MSGSTDPREEQTHGEIPGAAPEAARAIEAVRDREAVRDTPAVPPAADLPDLPDLLELDLAELRELDHPALAEVLERLRARVDGPTETLWGFNSAF